MRLRTGLLVGSILMVGVFVFKHREGAEVFAAEATRLRGVSEVNAALVLAAGSDIVRGTEPAVLVRPFEAALAREEEALRLMKEARSFSSLLFTRNHGRDIARAEKEVEQLRTMVDLMVELATTPREEWSPIVSKLQDSTKAYAEVHREIINKE